MPARELVKARRVPEAGKIRPRMTRAFAFRLLLTVLAVTSIVVAEARLIGLWTGAELPVNVVHAPSGQWVVRPLDDVPLPSPLRDGDVLVLKDMTRAARVAGEFGFAMPAGISFEFPVIQEGRLVYASVVTRVTKSSALERGGQWLNALFVVPLLAALALLPLWRGRGRASGGLCAFSMFALVGTAMSSAVMRPLPGFWLNETIYLSQFLVGFPALYVMAEALAESGLSRRMLRMTRFAFVGIDLAAVATAATATFGFVYGDLNLPRALDTLLPLLLASLLISLALLVLFAGYRKADHESRLRIRWVLWSTAVFLVVVIGLLGISANRHPYLFQAVHSMQWLVLLGYFYAAFRNRLVDVSFVVNRALVYAALTALLFGGFSVLELGLHQLAVGEKLGWALQAGAALLAAVALSPVHRRIEHRIERLFFRRQRLAIAAIRSFAAECAFVEQEDRLLQMVVERLAPHCAGVAVYERGRSGYVLRASRGRASPETLDVDDPAFVSLRARRREIELHSLESGAGPEGLALPMSVGERLTGAVICHPRDGEQFAPDVRAALVEAARNLGMSLYVLRYREQARLLADVAAGRMDLVAARSRASELIPGAVV